MSPSAAPDPAVLVVLDSGERITLEDCAPHAFAGATLYRAPDGRWLAPAFRGTAVDLGERDLPDPADDSAVAELVLDWVEQVRTQDWSDLRGAELGASGSQEEWLDLRTAMVRVGWGPAGAQAAWDACAARPYSRDLPTAAGWAGGGWVVPASAGEVEPAFAAPVLEARGLQRWAYITRWAEPAALPEAPAEGRLELSGTRWPVEPEPADLGWADVLSRLRADHYTAEAQGEAEELAVEVLTEAGLGPATAIEAEDEPLPDRHLAAAFGHASAVVRAAAWFLLRAEADTWLACSYNECGHHWAVEAEEDAYEMEEVLELASRGVTNPVDAAFQRRRLLTLAFGDISDVPLAGAGDLEDFIAFYEGWVAAGKPEDDFADAARELRADSD